MHTEDSLSFSLCGASMFDSDSDPRLQRKSNKSKNASFKFSAMLCAVYLHFCSSSTFKDPERASLRDSGHGDSDQADSDQDTNKGSCCDMSAKEALKLKATGVKPPPLEQGESSSLGHLCIYLKTKTMKQQPVFAT